MEIFNVISYNNGKILTKVKALSYDDAFNKCLELKIDVYSSYFIETIKETNEYNDRQLRTVYLDIDSE